MKAILALFPMGSTPLAAQAPKSSWVYPSPTGNLLYQLDERGQRINDFSNCGYSSGNEPLPNVTAVIPQSRWVYVSPPVAGDSTALIQAAIDSVEAMTPDANGWRGVVFLNAGEYQLASPISINASGVVLKGAGDDPVTGTRLRATATSQVTLISVAGSGSRTTVSGTTRNFTQKLVPAGSRTFEVDSTSGLAVGHTVIVERPATVEWIDAIDMNHLGAETGDPNAFPWEPNATDLSFDRIITRIDGNWITVDTPLPQTFELIYGGGRISRYTWSGRIEQVGIEDVCGVSNYASATDENHAWNFISISNAQNAWVRKITARHFGYSAVTLSSGAKWVTVADSKSLEPKSILKGGRRYSFNINDGQQILMVNNYTSEGRHDYVFGSRVAGPNAFVHCTADLANADSGPHQRWSAGGLFDLVTVNGNELNVENRGNSGTGHGWAGAYFAMWNTQAKWFRVRNPPTARNWLIGSIGEILPTSRVPVTADPPGTYESSGITGTGKRVHPRSLYYGQLQQRMKWPDSEFREAWLGDVDQHSSTGGTGEVVNCDPTWLAQVEAIDAVPAAAKFDFLAGNRYTAGTLNVPLSPGDTVLAASLTVSLRAIGSATTDRLWLDSTSSPLTFSSLGWNPISTTAPTVRTLEIAPNLLNDGRLNFALGSNVAVDFAVLHLQVQKAQASITTLALTPVADTFVQGGVNATINFGTNTSLQTKQHTSADQTQETFLRWNLSGVTGKILHAKVRLSGTTTGQIGNESCATLVSNDTWGETTITFANKPAAGKLFAQWLPVTGQAAEFTVTSELQDALLKPGKLLSLRILSTDYHGAAGNVSYASRENSTAADRPQLILTIENPPTAFVKAPGGTQLDSATTWTPASVPGLLDTATWNATSRAGSMSFGTDLNWSGLVINNPGSTLSFTSNRNLILGSAGIDMSASTVNLTLNHPVFLAQNQNWNIASGRSLAVNGPISGSVLLEKSGTGNLIFSGNNNYTGTAAIQQGTLQVDPGGTLGANTASLSLGSGSTGVLGAVGNLTLNTNTTLGALAIRSNTTASGLLSIASGRTLTVSGFEAGVIGTETVRAITNLNTGAAGQWGTLTVNGDFMMSEQYSTTTVNLSGLTAFNVQSPTGILSIGSNVRSLGTLTLANSTNVINVGTLSVGVTTSNAAGRSTLNLGPGTNAIQAPVINLGVGKAGGQILFPGSSGSVVISGAGGSGSSLITIGNSSIGSYSGGTNNLLLAGRSATVNASTVTIGQKSGNGTSNLGAFLTFDTGTFTANTIQMGVADGTSSGAITSGLTVGGATANSAATGVVNISGNLLLAAATAGTATPNSTFVINGGAVNINTALSAANGIFDTSVSAANSTTTLTLAGGTLNLNGGSIGGTTGTGKRNIGTLNFQSGTLRNVAQINDGAGLAKNTTGTLTLSGTNSYAGPTTISAGTLALGTGNALPNTSPLTIGAATLHATTAATEVAGTLTVSAAATIQLAPGAKIEFLASNTLAWPGTLNITGSFVSGVSLRFGNNASGLTTAQLAKISAPGYTGFVLNSNGYLTGSASVPSNTAPVAAAQSLTTAEDTALPITLSATDAEGDPLTYRIVTSPASGTLSGTAPNLTYIPATNFHGSASFTFRANDGTLDSAPATVSITITPVNDAPVFAANPIIGANATQNMAYNGTLAGSASDVDAGATLIYAKVNGPSWLSIATNGALSGTPTSSNAGLNQFTVSVSDGIAPVVTTTLNITVVVTRNLYSYGAKTWNSTTANWGLATGGPYNTTTWSSGDSAILEGTAGTVTLAGAISIKNLTFTNTAGLYNVTGSTLNFTAGTITAPNPSATGTLGARIESNITGAPAINMFSVAGDRWFTLKPAANGSMSIGAVTGNGGNGSAKLTLEGGAGSTGTIVSSSGPKVIVTAGSWTLNGASTGRDHSVSGGTLTLNANLTSTARAVILSGTGVLNYNVASAVSATAATNTSTDNGFRITGGTLDQTSGAAINTNSSTTHIDLGGNLTFLGSNGANSNLHLGSGVVWLKDGNRQITVTNAATTLTIGGVIQNDDTLGRSLTKAGAGTLSLGAANTYTGTTIVSAGTLRINGSTSTSSAVTVNGGNLGGTGTIGGNVTIAAAGNLAPGVTAGTLNITGNLDLSAMASGAGTLQFGLNALAGTNDRVAVGGSLALGTLALDDLAVTNLGGLQAGTYTLITSTGLTGTVSSSTALIATGFNGKLQTNGNNLELVVTVPMAAASLPPQSLASYVTWADGGGAFDADDNGDGVANGIAWLLGVANPSENALTQLPAATHDGTHLRLTFRCLKSTTRSGTSLKLQLSSDCGASDPWTSHEAAVPDEDATVNGVVFNTTEEGDYIHVIADIPTGGSTLFVRLSAANPE